MASFRTIEDNERQVVRSMPSPTNFERVLTRKLLPRSFPQKSNQAALVGMSSQIYVQNIGGQTRMLTIPHNLGYVPMAEVYIRNAAADESYDDTSRIFQMPIAFFNATPALSSYRWFYTDRTNLYILRQQIVASGAGTFKDFYHFYLYPDSFRADFIGGQATFF